MRRILFVIAGVIVAAIAVVATHKSWLEQNTIQLMTNVPVSLETVQRVTDVAAWDNPPYAVTKGWEFDRDTTSLPALARVLRARRPINLPRLLVELGHRKLRLGTIKETEEVFGGSVPESTLACSPVMSPAVYIYASGTWNLVTEWGYGFRLTMVVVPVPKGAERTRQGGSALYAHFEELKCRRISRRRDVRIDAFYDSVYVVNGSESSLALREACYDSLERIAAVNLDREREVFLDSLVGVGSPFRPDIISRPTDSDPLIASIVAPRENARAADPKTFWREVFAPCANWNRHKAIALVMKAIGGNAGLQSPQSWAVDFLEVGVVGEWNPDRYYGFHQWISTKDLADAGVPHVVVQKFQREEREWQLYNMFGRYPPGF